MKKFYLLILLLSISFSQDIKFFGTILDAETNEPIIDANIVFIESDFGSVSGKWKFFCYKSSKARI